MSPPVIRDLVSPGSPELNVHRFFSAVANELGPLEHAILEHLVDAGTSRGWFPNRAQLETRFTEHWPHAEVVAAVHRLVQVRAVELDEAGAVHGTVSGITSRRTHITARSDGVVFSLRSALDALTIAGTLQRRVAVTARCPETQGAVQLSFEADGSILDLQPSGAAAFIPGWDGVAPLADALAVGGFFTSDAALEAWQSKAPGAIGTPLGGDTLRFIGPSLAGPLAGYYVAMSVR